MRDILDRFTQIGQLKVILKNSIMSCTFLGAVAGAVASNISGFEFEASLKDFLFTVISVEKTEIKKTRQGKVRYLYAVFRSF